MVIALDAIPQTKAQYCALADYIPKPLGLAVVVHIHNEDVFFCIFFAKQEKYYYCQNTILRLNKGIL